MAVTVSRSAARTDAEANHLTLVTTDTDNLPPSVGFWASPAGTLSCRARENAAAVAIPVIAGVFYPVDLIEVDITGSTTVTTVVLARRHE